MCRVLEVSPSGYYAWRTRPVSAREMANQELVEKIKAVHAASYETYGSPRVFCDLRADGMACSRKRVARLMRLYHICAKQSRRYKTTTKRNQAHAVAPNLLKRDFIAERPDRKWLSDITTSLRRKVGSIWRSSWICSTVGLSTRPCRSG